MFLKPKKYFAKLSELGEKNSSIFRFRGILKIAEARFKI